MMMIIRLMTKMMMRRILLHRRWSTHMMGVGRGFNDGDDIDDDYHYDNVGQE